MSVEAESVDFDVIVIGAGVAGCVTAYQLATKGRSVLLVERGAKPGSKNLSGGIFYCRVMEQVMPGFVTEAPVERRITPQLPELPLADVVRERGLPRPTAGRTGERGDRAARQTGRMAGRQVRGGGSHPVAGSEGGFAPQERRPVRRHQGRGRRNALPRGGCGRRRELLHLPGCRHQAEGTHEAPCRGGEVGHPVVTRGDRGAVQLDGERRRRVCRGWRLHQRRRGGGFMYTNIDSVSIGVVLRLDDLAERGETSSDLHDRFVNHPAIEPFIRGGELLEYGCHWLPRAGSRWSMTSPVRAWLRWASGRIDAEHRDSLCEAWTWLPGRGSRPRRPSTPRSGRATSPRPPWTPTRPSSTGRSSGQDMNTYAKVPAFMENPRLYGDYGLMLSDVLYGIYNLDTSPRKHALPTAMAAFNKSPLKVVQVVKDILAALGGVIMVDLGTVAERLDKNHYETDEKQSHIEVDRDFGQDHGRRAAAGPDLCRPRLLAPQGRHDRCSVRGLPGVRHLPGSGPARHAHLALPPQRYGSDLPRGIGAHRL